MKGIYHKEISHTSQLDIKTNLYSETFIDSNLSDLEINFLNDVIIYPNSGIANRYKRLGISVRQGQKLKDSLAKKELIEDIKELTNTGTIRIIRLTEKGKEALKTHHNSAFKASE